MDAPTIANLVFSGVVALSTGVYAILTYMLVNETRTLRRIETEPHLSIYVEPSPRLFHATELVIVNMGRGPAYETRLTLEKGDWTIHEESNLKLSAHPLFSNTIRYLAPGQTIRTYVGQGPTLWKAGLLDAEIAASYRGQGPGTQRTEKFFVSIRHFEGITAVGEPPDIRLATAAEKIAAAFGHLIGSGHRLKVEVHTREEIARANRELVRRYKRDEEVSGEDNDVAPPEDDKGEH